MRIPLTLLLLTSFVFASKILTYNVYDRTDRVDIMFTFDTPYEGALHQSRQHENIVVKLDDAAIESPKVKNITSPFLSKLTIAPIGNQTQIIAKVLPSVVMQASKTSDAYGLRLRFSKPSAAAADKPSPAPAQAAALPTKPAGEYDQSYYIVIAILVIGILIMLWLKRKISKTASAPSKSWLFSKNKSKEHAAVVRFQKALDPKNRVVMLDYGKESYLVVIGNSNLLLDKFHDNAPVTQSEFDDMLQNKNFELDTFLQIDKQEKEPLQSYKDKASGMDYTV